MTVTKILVLSVFLNCCLLNSIFSQEASLWLSNQEQTQVLALQEKPLRFKTEIDKNLANIDVNIDKKYQSIDGFGFALTGGSAQHLQAMSAGERAKLLQELFGSDKTSVGISYLRLSIGASDLNDHVFSYNDLQPGETDVKLDKFDLDQDKKDIIPMMREILAINPSIKILASPWSAPTWMKTNGNVQGGRLKEEYYGVYATYFVKYVQEMKKNGIEIDAITIQNETFNDGNTPSMQMFAKEQLAFIKNHLGPQFRSNNIKTKIILYDHNCDAPEYPMSILADAEAAKYVDGSGFHLYTGTTDALSKVHDAFPDKALYFTEMMAVSRNGYNIAGPVDRILIGATRNWSRNVILWNLAANSKYEPHTNNGGCSICQGAVTIDGDNVVRNTAYYVIAHASKFVSPGALRVESSQQSNLGSVAFSTPDGKVVLIVANKDKQEQQFNVNFKGKAFVGSLSAGAVGTYVW
ncbi:MAG: glucosylceramidase [Pedobacter sp.]|nr:MAG: glucosylceramidase [Pedobacter sp.]